MSYLQTILEGLPLTQNGIKLRSFGGLFNLLLRWQATTYGYLGRLYTMPFWVMGLQKILKGAILLAYECPPQGELPLCRKMSRFGGIFYLLGIFLYTTWGRVFHDQRAGTHI